MTSNKAKKVGNYTAILHSAVFWTTLFCLISGSIPVSARHISQPADAVYCPLQKTWVRKNDPAAEAVRPEKTLDYICSSFDHKESFVFELSNGIFDRQISLTGEKIEKLFFKYLEEGKQAFAEIAPSNNLPGRQMAKNSAGEKSGSTNFKVDFARYPSETFGFEQLARPPTTRQTIKFNFQFVNELDKISRNINPRSPPFSI
jgi:hypothetical protein